MTLIDSFRQYKIPGTNGIVVFDSAATILGAIIVAKMFNFNFLVVLIILILASIFLHIFFNIPTMTNYYLGLSKLPKKI